MVKLCTKMSVFLSRIVECQVPYLKKQKKAQSGCFQGFVLCCAFSSSKKTIFLKELSFLVPYKEASETFTVHSILSSVSKIQDDSEERLDHGFTLIQSKENVSNLRD